ncbi:hypothetical protein PUL39_030480 [Pseudomonas aeruginosa]|uniref:hypothetical protein n=1 Tax=Pseudomonas aeruginosa TaxID=287 RepID=UPI0023B083B6|nr:hypothetical protein [Pseudomonas aeruginosa]MDE8660772.1 hypothetical protein [Pseudomonas aeruginosa]
MWRAGVIERPNWLPDHTLGESSNGEIAAFVTPAFGLPSRPYAEERERVLLDLSFAGWGGRIWALPVWPDIQLLASVTAAGAQTVECDTRWRDFRAGGLALLRGESAFEYEVVEIQDLDCVYGDPLNALFSGAFTAGSRLYPFAPHS